MPQRDAALELRPVTAHDADDLRSILGCAALRVRLYPTFSPQVSTEEAVFDWLATSDQRLALICHLRDAREPAGVVRLDGCEMAFAVRTPLQGQGLATRIVGQLLSDHVGPGRLMARVDRENVGSQRVLERNGFRFAGLDIPSASPVRLLYIADR